MPTVQVTPATSDLLQDIANILGKARKVVVVTGAGISTNSGIPDFRSENGLYSLIQAQFERAAASPQHGAVEDEAADFDISDRPTKRRRVSNDPEPPVDEPIDHAHTHPSDAERTGDRPSSNGPQSHDADNFRPRNHEDVAARHGIESPPERSSEQLTAPQAPETRPPFPRHLTQSSAHSSTSHDSVFSGPRSSTTSTQTEDAADSSAGGTQHHPRTSSTPKRILLGENVPSSPLSSPPPVLFDPFENTLQSTEESSRLSSDCSDSSDTEDTQQSLDFLSSQTSNPSLRNMKGRDLFDCNIWADPLKTSVFYRFATSLRQKVKEVQPTATHHFIAKLRDGGKLARVYTQNIDEIEKKIGLSTDLRNGAGSRKKRFARQQLADAEKDVKDNQDQPKGEEDPAVNGKVESNQPSSQNSETGEPAKPRPSLTPDKGVECVFLHGSLHSLRCFVCGKLCDWDEDDRESRTMSGEQPECPHCAGATAARQEKGKRALGVGKLRPDIVLYGEDHPQSDLISPIVQYDLSAGPDLLLVLGTSLRVHGLKVMVKEFAKAVHNKGGKVVFINFTKPSESAWGDVIDYWIEWDCDAWVTDLKDRKPHLWLSPEEIQEQEKQKRENLAEKRRGNLLKRDILGEKRRHTIDSSKPRVPPKNPSSMRNDYGCGAYVVYDIFQTLAKIGGRPFDNLGYTPRSTILPEPAPPPPLPPPSVPDIERVKAVKDSPAVKKIKRPRKSAPAALTSQVESKSETGPALKARPWFSTASKFKDRCAKTVRNGKIKRAFPMSMTPIPPPVIPLLTRRRPPVVPAPSPTQAPAPAAASAPAPAPAPAKEECSAPSQDSSTSIGAAVKSHPRRRKRKQIFEGPTVRPASTKPRRTAPQPTPRSVPQSVTMPASMPPATPTNAPQPKHGFMGTDYIAPQEGITLAPIRPGLEMPSPAIRCLEPNPVVSPPSPLAYPARALSRPYPYPSHPMLYSDPLVRLRYGIDVTREPRGIKNEERREGMKDSTPSPSDQLQREHWEAAASLMSLGIAP
ncbi:hypothetical protein DL764_003922 [Monosporascus ibericus]|uniref:Deacetylase sirtuin-type domain-containing protein n=1 Tax=Monosporascus ibericus TaxID=155417 RepID=A0A4Q4TEP7_9PEZI|nr:hypothetical protein DL764_003922 [Monosporascus ibericus]